MGKHTLKTTAQIYDQRQRLFSAVMRRGARRARAAHPETGGNMLLVHNWGNEAARAAFAQADRLWDRISASSNKRYAAAEHLKHGPTFRAMWGQHCRAEKPMALWSIAS